MKTTKKPIRVISFTGKPGTGKGTQVKYLKQALSDAGHNVSIISNGDIIRAYAKRKTSFSRRLKEHNDAGYLTPLPIFSMLIWPVFEKIFNKDSNDTIIWDGSPRSVKELDGARDVFAMLKIRALILDFEASDDVCLRRMEERKQKDPNRTEDTKTKLFEFYKEGNSKDAIDILKSSKEYGEIFIYQKINGEASIESVSKSIQKAVSARMKNESGI